MENLKGNAIRFSVRRRNFIRAVVVSGLATPFTESRAEEAASQNPKPRVCVYSEQFQSLSILEFCQVLKQMGVDGLDLTVRPGGHIEPQNVSEELPAAVQAARDHGLEIMMLTTGITAPDRNASIAMRRVNKNGGRTTADWKTALHQSRNLSARSTSQDTGDSIRSTPNTACP